MAEIPVERKEKSAFPMWLIPLLLLLLLLPLLYFTCGRGNVAVVDNTNANRAVVTANANNVLANAANSIGNGANTIANVVGNGANTVANANRANPPAAGRTIEAVNFFGVTPDKQTLVGRSANFRSARVERLLSDKVFTVKSENEEMFVLLDDKLDSPGGKESQIRVRAGQNVQLTGDFRPVPTQETFEEAQHGGLKLKDFEQMKNQRVYLHATELGNAP